jgi:hypothetical protein
MKTQTLSNAEAYVVRKHKFKLGLPKLDSRGNPIWSVEQIRQAFALESELLRARRYAERNQNGR